MIVWFIAKLATKDELKEKVKERNEKIETVFKSLDIHRVDCNSIFLRKDVADETKQHHRAEIERIEKVNADFRHEINGKLATINLKMDELKDLILNKK